MFYRLGSSLRKNSIYLPSKRSILFPLSVTLRDTQVDEDMSYNTFGTLALRKNQILLLTST